MEREQEDMQFLGLFGIYRESFIIILNFRRTFTNITLALILPLSFLFLVHIEVSDFLLSKIIYTEFDRARVAEGTYKYTKLSDTLSSEWAAFWLVKIVYFTFFLIFSLLSTSAVVYTVASIYIDRDVTFKKVMSIVPNVWKRLMLTFLCTFLAFFIYNVAAVVTLLLLTTVLFWIFTLNHVVKIIPFFFSVIGILYSVGFLYMAVAWQLASVISVLEDVKGFKAMAKSRNLMKGKMWIALVVFLKLNFAMVAILILFESLVVYTGSFGILGRLALGFVCLLMLSKVFLFGLVNQTVMYFVCKSYHHENIDKPALSDHLEVYLGEYVPIMNKDIQLEQFEV